MAKHLLTQTVDVLYEAASGAAAWSVAGDALCQLSDAASASLSIWDLQGGFVELVFTSKVPQPGWASAAYAEYYNHLDVWTDRALDLARAGDAAARFGEELVHPADFYSSEFYNDFAKHLNIHKILGAIPRINGHFVAPLGLHKHGGLADFTEADRRLVTEAVPHLSRALHIHACIRSAVAARGAGSPVLDTISTPAIVVDSGMSIRYLNPQAEALVRKNDPFRITSSGPAGIRDVALSIAHDRHHSAVEQLVQSVIWEGGSGGDVGTQPLGAQGRPLTVSVAPLPSGLRGRHPTGQARERGLALLLIHRRKAHAPVGEQVAHHYGLTQLEAGIAALLAIGWTPSQVASFRNIPEHAAQWHIRSILEKTGAATLTELAGKMSVTAATGDARAE